MPISVRVYNLDKIYEQQQELTPVCFGIILSKNGISKFFFFIIGVHACEK
jgi:hypothetical protein